MRASKANVTPAARARSAIALRSALAALKSLERLDIRAWVIGSLAKGSFREHSDVDFLVDCPYEREYEAFRAIERAMGDFPFDMVPCQRLKPDAAPYMIAGALDASDLLARQEET